MTQKITLGSGWYRDASSARISYRYHYTSSHRGNGLSLRLVRKR